MTQDLQTSREQMRAQYIRRNADKLRRAFWERKAQECKQ